ncbi:ABC transporter substrate-binding protein [Mycolicibacterium phlei]|uniref:ABC transporter substrate-binding protein n=1 Tax=Mycolicibacterium phlei TaxID=1771 RepID=UPI00025AD507|nr:ABC transporter substrate-binding protein [Mycolicibacterium phlei]EID10622.1 transporter peptide-binding protein [Mycolicibacterium phlei RIVM601174]MBF4194014.1 transporter peptide-binding protein [Mycolicibacterium phlei]
MTTIRTTVLFAATALALSACSGSNNSGAPAETGEPVAGGTLNYALAEWPRCVDPALRARGLSAPEQFADTLTDQDRTTGEVLPRLAERWEVAPGAKQVTLHLRDGVTFSDGTPLTAEVVKANLDNLKEITESGKAETQVISALNTYEGATVVDPKTVRVEFSEPELGFLRNISDPYFSIYAPATLESSLDDRCAGKNLIGTGPFVISEVVNQQKIVLDKRDDYGWPPAGLTDHTGAAYLDRIVFEVVPESGVRVGGLLSGQFDVVDDVPVIDQDNVTAQGATILTGVVPNLVPGLRQNPLSPFGGDTVVRQAIQKSIDREEIRDTLYTDRYSIPTSAIAANTPLHKDVSEYLRYDPDGAQKLLADNGWTKGDDGVWVKDGRRLAPKVMIVSGSAQGATQQELELIQQQLNKVGIAMEILPVTQAEYAQLMKNKADGGYDFLAGSGPAKDVDFLAGLFLNTNPALEGSLQVPLQDAANRLNLAATDEERVQAAADLQELLVRDGYWIPVREQTKAVGVAPNVHGVTINPYGATVLYDTWKADGAS